MKEKEEKKQRRGEGERKIEEEGKKGMESVKMWRESKRKEEICRKKEKYWRRIGRKEKPRSRKEGSKETSGGVEENDEEEVKKEKKEEESEEAGGFEVFDSGKRMKEGWRRALTV